MSKDLTETLREAFGRFGAQDLAGTARLCEQILKQLPRQPEALHLLGVVRLMSGNARETVALIGRALEVSPRDAAMLENLGVAQLALRDFGNAEASFRRALDLGATQGLLYMRLGLALGAQHRWPEAVGALRMAAEKAPTDPDVLLNLGNALAEQGQSEEALACFNKVTALQPRHVIGHFNLGALYQRLDRFEEAVAAFKRALEIAPNDADTHNNLGIVYEKQKKLDDAAMSYRRALAANPRHVQAQNNLGNVLRAQGRIEEAVARYENALGLNPDHVDAYVNLGNARAEQGRYDEARALYEKALRVNPSSFEAHLNLGRLLRIQGETMEALAHYRRILELDSRQAFAHRDTGGLHRQAGEFEAAIACYRKAIEIDPRDADTYFDLAETLKLQGRLQETIPLYEQALELKPDHWRALNGLIHIRQHLCDWAGIEASWEQLRSGIGEHTDARISPFSILSLPTSAAEQLVCARTWAEQELAPVSRARSGLGFDFSPRRAPARLRIGYLSWDFHKHATAYLIAELFELHDRGRFEVVAYAYGPDDGSAVRARIKKACDRFVDVASESFVATARRIYRDEVDILVDLKGYTQGARTQILALRPAPIQVNWLGYPGTMGTDCIDHLIADPFIVPVGMESNYSEHVIRLPDCYQINDRQREASARIPTRRECGLPDGGMVFCCFNLSYKILPDVFTMWMRILQAAPGSVLWLLEANPWAGDNLRRAAAAHGVAPERLVFAPRRPLAEHLARYHLADLALDTFPYTSHTTASDALWMGCPLVTRAGETFASRVAGSILVNAGMRELVTDSFEAYERLAIELAASPEKLRDIRRRLQASRATCPLFDTPRFVRNLEQAYGAIFDAHSRKD
jgi:protein O-GlcNAc transferase